jgi:hypothetical protein
MGDSWSTGERWHYQSEEKRLTSPNNPVYIAPISQQQLGVVSIRRSAQQVMEAGSVTAAWAFNRGLLRLIATGKEFKFSLNSSSAELVVKKDEIVFGGRRFKSLLVKPVPDISIIARTIYTRIQQRANIANTFDTFNALLADGAQKQEAHDHLKNDQILIEFLTEVAKLLQGDYQNDLKTHRLNVVRSETRSMFQPKFQRGGNNANDSGFDGPWADINTHELSEFSRYEMARTSAIETDPKMHLASFRNSETLRQKLYPAVFSGDGSGESVEELFNFNNLVERVVERSLAPELFIKGQTSADLKASGMRVKKVDDKTWIVDIFTIGDVTVEVTAETTTGGVLNSTRYFVNGYQIKAVEVIRVVTMATCFENTETYNETVAQISEVSLAARDILQNGFHASVDTNYKTSNIMLEIDRIKNKWVLVIRDKDGNVTKNVHIPGGVTRFISVPRIRNRVRKMTVESFAALLDGIPELAFIDIKRIHENGFTRYNEIIARSRKFLEDVIGLTKASFGTFELGGGVTLAPFLDTA